MYKEAIMTLGEQISRLRAEKGLSQEKLANTLRVSRQSGSKWETNVSVPELDKLLKLSEVFGATLDKLVKGVPSGSNQAVASAEPAATNNSVPQPAASAAVSGTQKITDIILLCFGVLIALLLLFLTGNIGICILGMPFLLCGLLCLMVKHRAGFWCGWVWFSAVMLYLYLATGIRWTVIFRTVGYDPTQNYIRLAAAWGMFLVILLMVVCTIRSFRCVTIALTRRTGCLLGLGWLFWLAVPPAANAMLFQPWGAILSQPPYPSRVGFEIVWSIYNILRFAAFNALLVCFFALLRGRRQSVRASKIPHR